jgi:DNA helicase II / ATP-dependent DNA helicase PcrA
MLSPKNRMVVASAGARKTTSLVEDALALANSKVLITTYTTEGLAQINSYLIKINGCVPPNVSVSSWFSFLLRDGVRPYQNFLTAGGRIANISFVELGEHMKFTKKSDASRYYLTAQNDIHNEKVSEFVCECDERSGGRVIKRLEKIYRHILIDEFQDLAGYDLDFIEKLFRSSIAITTVGDPRQATFSTNNSQKNKKFRKSNIYEWIEKPSISKLIRVEHRNECYRGNQAICDFADRLFPEFPRTTSKNLSPTGHDGIFFITRDQVNEYFAKYKPMVLRYSKKSDTMGFPALNVGVSKGSTHERVLIFTTGPWEEYLKSYDLAKVGDRIKLYIAITRARHSVAFVTKVDLHSARGGV